MENVQKIFDALQGDWRHENDEAFFTIENDDIKVKNGKKGKLEIKERGSEFYSTSPLWDNCKLSLMGENNFNISYFPTIAGTKEDISQSVKLAVISFVRAK